MVLEVELEILPIQALGIGRKLAVLLHKLWVTGQVYEPLYGIAQAA